MTIVRQQTSFETTQFISLDGAAPTTDFEIDLVVSEKVTAAEDVVALTLRDPDGGPLPRWTPGAHIDLVLGDAPTRQYSLCSEVENRDSWRVGVLRNSNGRGGSRYVHDDLQVGDTIRVRGPRNHFPLAESPRYLFVAGGIGITPILPMIAAAEAAGAEWQLAYGGNRRASMAFVDELERYGNRVTIWPQDERGLLDLDGLLGTPLTNTKVFCCGPEPLLAAVEDRCEQWPSHSLHVERFNAKPIADSAEDAAFEVYLTQSDQTFVIPPDRSILDVVEDAGVAVQVSCGEGTCGTCETPVLDGEPDHRDTVLNDDERRANDCMMICVSRACTPRLVLDL
ncbi:oxidoreductase [Rhodococcus pseudokoreensis]|uniref:Oxidoreductase n=1 Tax=Rhodococcus pseudokoreensis TaxID=2811421 RepID=A0A974W5C2_9NOCA|nr:PDR/VanB family oxidoreductase [Rhodococcus pseudokoreensis]QSE90663.1 oxidoreductase [Rhodococcus pseudokoreensis]